MYEVLCRLCSHAVRDETTINLLGVVRWLSHGTALQVQNSNFDVTNLINIIARTVRQKWNESGSMPHLCTYRLNWARRIFWGWLRWLRWHCPPDKGFENRALAVRGRARYLLITEATHNTDFPTWMGEEHFLFLSHRRDREPNPGLWRERQWIWLICDGTISMGWYLQFGTINVWGFMPPLFACSPRWNYK